MQEHDGEKLNHAQIELHLKSAVDTLIPNVLDRIDLSTPQDVVPRQEYVQPSNIAAWNRRMRGIVLAGAACLCVMVMGGGAFHYQYLNRRVESVIGIDVNPSVELSINRKDKVLTAQPLNAEAQEVMAEMDLEGVDLNVAVNAVIGAMVTHGYLDDLDNAILVTVSNDSIKKASELRTNVVGDIERTLEDNQVQAVVYDQQVVERDEMKALADEYGISYGKAYFLKELIDQNADLTMDDMKDLSSMTMEEIAEKITDSSYALGDFADKGEDNTTVVPTTVDESTTVETTTEEETETSVENTTEESTTVPTETSTVPPATEVPAEAAEVVEPDRIEIDYVDYEDGSVYVYFVTKVMWKNPTVSVRDEDGNSYAAMVDETSGSDCVLGVSGLVGGKSYTFVIGGLIPAEGGSATTVKGYFDKPEIADEATEPDDGEEESTEAPETTAEETTASETTVPEESTTEPAEEPTTEETTGESTQQPSEQDSSTGAEEVDLKADESLQELTMEERE